MHYIVIRAKSRISHLKNKALNNVLFLIVEILGAHLNHCRDLTAYRSPGSNVVLKKVSEGLSRVEAGNPGFPRLVQVTSGGFSWWL